MMNKTRSDQFKIDQVIGSCLLSGIVVSDEQKELLRKIMSGELDPEQAKAEAIRLLSDNKKQ
jgi:hypothetical protein